MAGTRQSFGRQVYELLMARLQNGEFGPGDRLVDAALSVELGVSRMPVREALTRLENEGYLTGTSRGFVIAEPTIEDALEIFEMRRLLEPRAAATAARTLPPEAIARLDRAHASVARAVELDDSIPFADAIREFRMIWLAYVPNQRLAETVGRFVAQIDGIQKKSFVDVAGRLIVLDSLTALLIAFKGGDSLAANDIVGTLIDRGRDLFAALVARAPPSDGLRSHRSALFDRR